jgi:hypothetical protein
MAAWKKSFLRVLFLMVVIADVIWIRGGTLELVSHHQVDEARGKEY